MLAELPVKSGLRSYGGLLLVSGYGPDEFLIRIFNFVEDTPAQKNQNKF